MIEKIYRCDHCQLSTPAEYDLAMTNERAPLDWVIILEIKRNAKIIRMTMVLCPLCSVKVFPEMGLPGKPIHEREERLRAALERISKRPCSAATVNDSACECCQHHSYIANVALAAALADQPEPSTRHEKPEVSR